MFTKRDDFSDFDARLEARINDGGNSGVFFRTDITIFPIQNWQKPEFLEANISGRTRLGRWTCWAVGPAGKSSAKVVRPNEWFEIEIIARGPQITFKVNGRTTVDFTDPSYTYKRGPIILQQLFERTEVRFRKIELMELKRTK